MAPSAKDAVFGGSTKMKEKYMKIWKIVFVNNFGLLVNKSGGRFFCKCARFFKSHKMADIVLFTFCLVVYLFVSIFCYYLCVWVLMFWIRGDPSDSCKQKSWSLFCFFFAVQWKCWNEIFMNVFVNGKSLNKRPLRTSDFEQCWFFAKWTASNKQNIAQNLKKVTNPSTKTQSKLLWKNWKKSLTKRVKIFFSVTINVELRHFALF